MAKEVEARTMPDPESVGRLAGLAATMRLSRRVGELEAFLREAIRRHQLDGPAHYEAQRLLGELPPASKPEDSRPVKWRKPRKRARRAAR